MSDGSVSTSLQAAYILHYRQWQDASFIVDAFTLTHGRVALMARSARKSQPRTRALYQPFRPLLLSWVGASDLRTLTGIEESGAAMNLANAELACGYYLNELVMRILGKDQPQTQVFAHYAMALADLAHGEQHYEQIIRAFELQMLDALGLLPDLANCTPDGSSIAAEQEYRYHPANAVAILHADKDSEHGLLKQKHRENSGVSQNAGIHADGFTPDKGILVSGQTLLALSELDLSNSTTLAQSRPLMRAILKVHLGDKPLKSRELFATLTPTNSTPTGQTTLTP